jgi:ABC-type nitrate/sulfonate/bicarbonate transport system substrate-binding protein
MTIGKKHKTMSRTIFGIGLLLAFMVLTASCQKPEKSTGPKEKVTIGVASLVLSAPLMVAQEQGFFSDEGIEVTYKSYTFGKKALEAMFVGEVDIATVAETPIVFNSFIRDDFVVFATFAYSYDDSKILGRKDRGVSMPADLKGKKIGITAKTSSHFFAHIYLAEHGIDPSSVKLVDFAGADLPDALKEGKVDAIAAFEPYAYRAMKALPDQFVRLPKSDLFKETFNLAAMKSYTKEHPEKLKKVLKAVNRAMTYIKQNKKESLAITAKWTGMEETILATIWDDFVFDLSLDHSLFTIFEDEARWAMKNGFTDKTKVPNYLGYFYLEAMKTVKPKAVTIIK